MTAADQPVLIAFEVTLDCADAARLAAFWKDAIGYVEHGDPGPGTAWLTDPRRVAPHLALLEVVRSRGNVDATWSTRLRCLAGHDAGGGRRDSPPRR